MKSRLPLLKWLIACLILGMFLTASIARHSVAAQEDNPPTPTDTPAEVTPTPTEAISPSPTETPTEPEPTAQAPSEAGPQALAASAVSQPQQPDPDCSDGECVFWVSASTDDAGPNPVFSCGYRTNWNEVYMGECPNHSGIVSGFRFAHVNLPAGAPIARAYIEFTVDGPYSDDLSLAFYGQATGNAQPFSSLSRPDNRSLTQSSVAWPIPASDPWTLGELRNSPDITTIIQEIVNRPDWASGNALAIILKNAGPASGVNRHRRVIGYDRPVWYPGTENAARLVIRIREPVILLPGGTGSRIYAPQSFDWSQPDGHGGTYANTYPADQEIWINALAMLDPDDDYFDVLRLEKDGVTQSTAAHYGVNLEARKIVDVVDVYNSLLADLQNAGYQPGVDLFVFPYDWRLDIAGNAALLDNMVQSALEKANGTADPSRWTITKVNLLSHSLGASVAREYIRDPLHAARVHRLIAIAPAYLGAPKFTKLILFGDPFYCLLGICPLNTVEVKDIAQNMPGLFEVAPSRAYWTFYEGSSGNSVAFQEDRDFDGDGQASGALSYSAYKSMFFRLDKDPYLDWDGTGKDINETVFNMSESFHDRLDFSWDSGIPIPEADLIAGTGQCTIGQIQPTYRIKLKAPFVGPIQIGPIVRLNYVNGDNTVPLFSATLYDPARGIDHRGGAKVYYVARNSTDHAFLPSKDSVRQLVVNLLNGNDGLPGGIIPQADVPKGCKATVINVESPVELHVTDAAGNHTGWASLPDTGGPVIEQGIPDSMYNEIDETKSVVLPNDGVYTISLNATGSGSFNLNLVSYKSDGTVQSILYLRVPLTTTTTGKMTYDTTSTEPPLLYLDHNGDGVFDERITATSVLGATKSVDAQPPQIVITSPMQGEAVSGSALIAWHSNDDLSGVLNEWGYIDVDTPNVLQVANGLAVTLPVGLHTLTVLAEDRAGNASQQTVTFTIAYNFTGFFPPVNNQPTLNVVKAGSAVPVKFSLNGYQGLDIFAEGYPTSAAVACGSAVEDAIEQTVTAGASSLSYDASTDQYIYVWKTDKAWADTCRTFVLKLNDGTYHRADFKFMR